MNTTNPAQVWVMTKGEIGDGGNVLGVYTTKDAAKTDFVNAAADMLERIGEIDTSDVDVQTDPDTSAITVTIDPDVLTLEPFDVRAYSHTPIEHTSETFEAYTRRVLDAPAPV